MAWSRPRGVLAHHLERDGQGVGVLQVRQAAVREGRSMSAASADPFADDVLERLVRSNGDYQREHGNYIVPLAARLLAARKALREIAEGEFDDLDPNDGLHETSARAVARAALRGTR